MSRISHLYKIYKSISALFCVGMLFSCSADIDRIQYAIMTETAPDEVMHEISSVLTDSGEVKFEIIAPTLHKFYNDDDPKSVFPDGINVVFYNKEHVKESILSAKYGVIYEKENRMEVMDSVRFENILEEQLLETEKLIWTQDSAKIFTDEAVTITEGDNMHSGSGMVANETFSEYEIIDYIGSSSAGDTDTDEEDGEEGKIEEEN